MFLLIDNYDSFTYNLVQAFYSLGQKPLVVKNDDPALLNLARDKNIEKVCLSPGPGRPETAGLCMEFLKNLDPTIPVLGVCLGHQILGLFADADIVVGPEIMHGKESDIVHDGKGIFAHLPNPLRVGRYHSLVVQPKNDFSDRVTITARGPEGEVMALSYNERPWIGVQFHPESILTPDGSRILENFLKLEKTGSTSAADIRHILDQLALGNDLSADMAASAFGALFDGELSPAQAGALLLGLRIKGESPLELAHATRAALARSVRVNGITGVCIDVVGTGGDGKNSFNCSTATSLVLAGLGYKVVKHGNRAVSSKCGSADALEALGLPLENNPENAIKMLDDRNFTFLYAPYFHPGFRNIGPIRKELGIRTLFNILGPMINPARPSHLLMGVARPELVSLVAETLVQSQLHRAAVVCGAGGYDEITPIGPVEMALLHDGKISTVKLDPADYGIATCTEEDLAVNSREEAVETLKLILAGKGPKPMQDMVVLNVAVALALLEETYSLDQAMAIARQAVMTGVGQRVLQNA